WWGGLSGFGCVGSMPARMGRGKPVIAARAVVLLACLAWILFGPHEMLPPYVVGFVAGASSGAAMIPYTVIKEANPANLSGTATGVVNFLNFTLSALLGPVFAGLLARASGGGAERTLEHYQAAFQPLLLGVALAIVLTWLRRETAPAVTGPARLATTS